MLVGRLGTRRRGAKFAFCELIFLDSTHLLLQTLLLPGAGRPGRKMVIFASRTLKSSLYADHQSGYGRNYRGGRGGYGGRGRGEVPVCEGGAAVVGGADGGGQGGVYRALL